MALFIKIGRSRMPFTRVVNGWHLDIVSHSIEDQGPPMFWRAEVQVFLEGSDTPVFKDHTIARHASQVEAERIAEGLGTDFANANNPRAD